MTSSNKKFKIALGLCLLSSAALINAQDSLKKNLLINGDFESPKVQEWQIFKKDSKQLKGWNGHDIQIGKAKFYNKNWKNNETNQVAEMDSVNNVEMIQKVNLQEGEYQLSFDCAARQGKKIQTSKLQVYWNGVLIKEVIPKNYNIQHVDLTIKGNGGQNTLTLKGAGVSDTFGITVDNVILVHSNISHNRQSNEKEIIKKLSSVAQTPVAQHQDVAQRKQAQPINSILSQAKSIISQDNAQILGKKKINDLQLASKNQDNLKQNDTHKNIQQNNKQIEQHAQTENQNQQKLATTNNKEITKTQQDKGQAINQKNNQGHKIQKNLVKENNIEQEQEQKKQKNKESSVQQNIQKKAQVQNETERHLSNESEDNKSKQLATPAKLLSNKEVQQGQLNNLENNKKNQQDQHSKSIKTSPKNQTQDQNILKVQKLTLPPNHVEQNLNSQEKELVSEKNLKKNEEIEHITELSASLNKSKIQEKQAQHTKKASNTDKKLEIQGSLHTQKQNNQKNNVEAEKAENQKKIVGIQSKQKLNNIENIIKPIKAKQTKDLISSKNKIQSQDKKQKNLMIAPQNKIEDQGIEQEQKLNVQQNKIKPQKLSLENKIESKEVQHSAQQNKTEVQKDEHTKDLFLLQKNKKASDIDLQKQIAHRKNNVQGQTAQKLNDAENKIKTQKIYKQENFNIPENKIKDPKTQKSQKLDISQNLKEINQPEIKASNSENKKSQDKQAKQDKQFIATKKEKIVPQKIIEFQSQQKTKVSENKIKPVKLEQEQEYKTTEKATIDKENLGAQQLKLSKNNLTQKNKSHLEELKEKAVTTQGSVSAPNLNSGKNEIKKQNNQLDIKPKASENIGLYQEQKQINNSNHLEKQSKENSNHSENLGVSQSKKPVQEQKSSKNAGSYKGNGQIENQNHLGKGSKENSNNPENLGVSQSKKPVQEQNSQKNVGVYKGNEQIENQNHLGRGSKENSNNPENLGVSQSKKPVQEQKSSKNAGSYKGNGQIENQNHLGKGSKENSNHPKNVGLFQRNKPVQEQNPVDSEDIELQNLNAQSNKIQIKGIQLPQNTKAPANKISPYQFDQAKQQSVPQSNIKEYANSQKNQLHQKPNTQKTPNNQLKSHLTKQNLLNEKSTLTSLPKLFIPRVNLIKNGNFQSSKHLQPFTGEIESWQSRFVQIGPGNLYNQNWDSQVIKMGDDSKQVLTQVIDLPPGNYELSFDWSNVNSNEGKGQIEVFWNNRLIASLRSNQNIIKRQVIRVKPCPCCGGRNILEFRSSFQSNGNALTIDNVSLVEINKIGNQSNN